MNYFHIFFDLVPTICFGYSFISQYSVFRRVNNGLRNSRKAIMIYLFFIEVVVINNLLSDVFGSGADGLERYAFVLLGLISYLMHKGDKFEFLDF